MERKMLIVSVDMIAEMLSNKKLQQIDSELFMRSRKLDFSLVLLHNLILLYQKY